LEREDAGFPSLKGASADQVLGDIRAAQVSAVFRQMPVALAVNLLNAAITVIVLQQLAAATVPFAWLFLVTLVTAGRWVLWQRYRRAHPKSKTLLIGHCLRTAVR
jgi:hypothetical protein